MRRLATHEHETVIRIPKVVRFTIVRVEPTSIDDMAHEKQAQITIRVVAYKTPSIPPLFDCS